jgi:peroxiredoxin
MPLSVGAEAPDFELTDQHGQLVRLSDLKGRRAALVVFYPWAFSGVCGSELHAMQAALDELVSDDLALFTISTDSMYALRTFADREGFTFPMLSDFWPHGAVAEAYGVLHPDIGIALRGTFLVDRDGIVRWTVVNSIPDAREVDDYRTAIAALG